MEFIVNSDLLCSCNLHPQVLSWVTARFNSGSCISEGDKDVFWNHDQHLEVVLLFPPKSRGIEGIQAVLGFPKLKIVKPSETRWLLHERCVRQFARNCLHSCKSFHSYTSHLEMLRHMIYTPFWLVLMVHQAAISYRSS